MQPSELARWIREEHEKVLELGDRLRRELAIVPRTDVNAWIDRVRERFEHFRAHQQQHMALEEREGYMKVVLERRPTLSKQVERLRHEHGEITRIMADVAQAVAVLTSEDRLLARDCSDRMANLLAYVEHHERDEELLITYAFTQDIGTED